jgi:hypothetical protein
MSASYADELKELYSAKQSIMEARYAIVAMLFLQLYELLAL